MPDQDLHRIAHLRIEMTLALLERFVTGLVGEDYAHTELPEEGGPEGIQVEKQPASSYSHGSTLLQGLSHDPPEDIISHLRMIRKMCVLCGPFLFQSGEATAAISVKEGTAVGEMNYVQRAVVIELAVGTALML